MNPIDGSSGLTDNALRVFVASARSGSFSSAAIRLGIGQPAVSHAISRLERALGVRLFDRSPKGITLTVRGSQLHDRIGPHFDEIDRATAALAGTDGDRTVTLSVSTSLATYWLMPRLPQFKSAHPDITLRIITTDSDRSVGNDDADLWIPLGSVNRDDLRASEFCDEEVVPVAAPLLAKQFDTLDPTALLRAPLIALEERYAPRFDWITWFAHHGLGPVSVQPAYTSNDYSLVIQAALDGQGIALGWHHIVSDLVTAGRLVPCGPPVRTNSPFPILERPSPPAPPHVATFRDWLVDLGHHRDRSAVVNALTSTGRRA